MIKPNFKVNGYFQGKQLCHFHFCFHSHWGAAIKGMKNSTKCSFSTVWALSIELNQKLHEKFTPSLLPAATPGSGCSKHCYLKELIKKSTR